MFLLRDLITAVDWRIIRTAVMGLFLFLNSQVGAQTCDSWISCGLNGLRGEAVFQEISRFEQARTDEVLKQFAGNDQEIVQRLGAYKSSVANGAYRQTLRLCVAYREALGLGPVEHASGEKTKNYPVGDSLRAWGEIFNHGLYQSVDGLVGLKSDYISVAGVGFFDFENWFKSIYAMNFVTSTGFLYGASHCLNTVNSREIQKFASAILVVDYQGSLLSQAGLTWSIAKLTGLILSPLNRWVLHPLRTVFSELTSKISKPRLVVAAIPLGIVLGDAAICRLARMEMAQKNLEGFLAQLKASSSERLLKRREELARVRVALNLAASLQKYLAACPDPRASDLGVCRAALAPFVEKARSSGFINDLESYSRDRESILREREAEIQSSVDPALARKLYSCYGSEYDPRLGRSQPKLSGFRQQYLDVLEILLPIAQDLKKQNLL